jgi:basic amino acid/polyamine antiporter, APA family
LPPAEPPARSTGLLGATGVGLGAIVGGGILVLAGVAFQNTGPGTIVAFAANGLIAVLTALTFAELATSFPESGGAYTYAKKVLSVRVAFAVGWVVWFAYIVTGVLYALGFAEYAALVLAEVWRAAAGEPPAWLLSRSLVLALAVLATAGYTLSLIRKATGGGQWVTAGKVLVFVGLIIAGLWVLGAMPAGTTRAGFSPLLTDGPLGLLRAMGFTFITLQGFEIIATTAGEVRDPRRTLPRSMLLSLGGALAIYLPLLFVIAAVGVPPGGSLVAMSTADPGTVMAAAVQNYLGAPGYWLVVTAALLSTLSALQANILAASRVAYSMARDRVLPRVLAGAHERRGTPVMALYASALALVVTMLMVPNVAAAGAAASLIFLISFALTHWTGFLARRRAGAESAAFRAPLFPAVQVVGGLACGALAIFQAVAVPSAGAITVTWLGLGVLLYMGLFARKAQLVDAFAEAADPELVKYRGRSPLVLVPVANPASAASLVAVANALAPPAVGRVLLLSVIQTPSPEDQPAVQQAVTRSQEVLREALTASLAAGHAPEALMTVSPAPWDEIARVADNHDCESLLLGMHSLDQVETIEASGVPLEKLLNEVECDVSILRAAPGWQLDEVERVLIPVGGKGVQDELRARLLGSLWRSSPRPYTFLRVLGPDASEQEREETREKLLRLAEIEAPRAGEPLVLSSDDVVGTVAEQAGERDLIVLGLPRIEQCVLLGEVAIRIARSVPCPTILLSRRG